MKRINQTEVKAFILRSKATKALGWHPIKRLKSGKRPVEWNHPNRDVISNLPTGKSSQFLFLFSFN